jgi:carboxyl-terminal processing protease
MFNLKKPTNSIISVLIVLALFCQQTAFAAVNKINDVKADDPNLGIYGDVINSNALTLDQNGNLRPDAPINRAAFLKAAMTYAGFAPGKSFNYFTGYSDVPEESWFAPYIKKALDIRAISNPVLNSKFNPNDNITRQEGLLLTMSIFGIPTPFEEPTAKELFKDIRPTHPLAHVYMAAFLNAIYFENDQQNFRPNKILTRGDAADLLFKTKMATGKGSIRIDSGINTSGLGSVPADLLNNDKFRILVDTWSKINQQYVYTDKINADKLVYGAIEGMVNQLDDPYSNFRAPNPDGEAYIYIPENYEGIGAVIDQKDNNYIIQTTINNSPADRAGLKSQDVIVLLDGKEIKDLTPEQVTGIIKGKAGTYLKIQIKRGEKLLDFSIIREKINLDSIHKEVLSNGINYLRIDQFTESSNQDFDKFLPDIINSGSNKLIIDLRNNPGGYLTATQNILGHFLEQGKVEFYTQDKNKSLTPFYSEGNADLKNQKIVVLINEGSASASEIMAGALQDGKLAHLIGTTSFGKGSVQEITSYDDNSSLKLSIAQWLTPNKRNINHVGVTPDQVVSITDLQKANGQDPQLDAAINYLK